MKIISIFARNFFKLKKIKESRYFICFIFLFFAVLLLDIIIYIYEVPEQNTINSIPDIIWWNIVTLTTVGYGDMYPTTPEGRLATVIIMVCGIATLAYILSGVVEYAFKFYHRKEQGILRTKMEDHIIVCNWNDRAGDLVSQLKLFNNNHGDIVVIDNTLETRPISNIDFVKGSPSDTKILLKANIEKAQKVVILAKGDDKFNADANTVLTSLAIRNLSSEIFICAEILDTSNIIFLKNANVNEIIDINSIVSRFIAQTTYNPRMLRVLNELVSNDDKTCEIYRIKLPEKLQSNTFRELFRQVKEKHDCIVIALEDSKKNNIRMNPEMDEEYTADYCFVIAKSEPVMV